jgi:malonyl-CoA/methylmalonyl-CoA synthetase
MKSMSEAWHWEPHDHVLHVLPLHHTHGLINVLCTALWNGAHCEMMPFHAGKVWERFTQGDPRVFMAVPTIYHKLLEYWEAQTQEWQDRAMAGVEKMRLMVSGSAALPEALFKKWYAITGHPLLERYGMTEIGMAISNPYEGERRPGTVGRPMPGVQVRLATPEGLVQTEGEAGQIEIQSDQLFSFYHGQPEATQKSFSEDGWFMTGDVAVLEKGYYRILGRSSVHIIKSGGYKISALEIEAVLLEHPGIKECAVFALPDEEWGERVAAAIVAGADGLDEALLHAFLQGKLPNYKIPSRWFFTQSLPRNAMGKVTKKALPAFLGLESGD